MANRMGAIIFSSFSPLNPDGMESQGKNHGAGRTKGSNLHISKNVTVQPLRH